MNPRNLPPVPRKGRRPALLPIACLILFGAALVWGAPADGRASKGSGIHLDLHAVANARKARIIINVIDIHIVTSVGLRPKNVDAQLESGVGCYKVTVDDAFRAKRICEELESVKFCPSEMLGMDLRYRIDFLNGDRVIRRLYADIFGQVLINGKMYEAKGGNEWIANIFESICHELYFKRK